MDLPRAEMGADIETASDASYQWQNRRRHSASPPQLAQFTWAGEGRFERDGNEVRVGPGDLMVFTFPDNSSYRHPGSPAGPWTFSWVSFTGFEVVWDGIRARHGSVLRLGLASKAGKLLRRLAGDLPAFPDPWSASLAAYQFVMQLGREVADVGREPDTRLAQARDFLLHHASGAAGVKEVAARFGYSREHFSRLFAERYGESPGELLRRARLRRARALLGQSHFALARVAALSGFASAAALCRAFRDHTGLAPNEWRERARRGRGPSA